MSTKSQDKGHFRTTLSNSSLNANSFEIILLTGSIRKEIKGPVSFNKGITPMDWNVCNSLSNYLFI